MIAQSVNRFVLINDKYMPERLTIDAERAEMRITVAGVDEGGNDLLDVELRHSSLQEPFMFTVNTPRRFIQDAAMNQYLLPNGVIVETRFDNYHDETSTLRAALSSGHRAGLKQAIETIRANR